MSIVQVNRGIPGFTLAELLIALAILGVIAAFAIPKILSSTEDERSKAVFKETYSTLSQILIDERLKGTLNTNVYTVIAAKINAIKVCDSNRSPKSAGLTRSIMRLWN